MTGRSTVRAEGWLVKSRDRGLRFPILKSKWARRYYVLRCEEVETNAVFLDEYRSDNKRRLRKSINLLNCTQVDSHLQLTDASCASRGGMNLQWIFSIHICDKGNYKESEMYLAADTEQEMNMWVLNLCRAMGLARHDQEDIPSRNEGYLAQPPNGGGYSADSITAQAAALHLEPTRSHSTAVNYQLLRSLTAGTPTKEFNPPLFHHGRLTLGEASSVSSLTSSRSVSNTDDEASSTCSGSLPGPPLPPLPPRIRESREGGGREGWRELPLNDHVPLSSSVFYDDAPDNESSGETIKLREAPGFSAPPAVDRSKKPRPLQNHPPLHLPTLPRTTPRTSHLEYIEPAVISTRHRSNSPRSPPPDLDYIKIDEHKTQAIKQTIASQKRSAGID